MFADDRLHAALLALRQESGVAEAVILSTCNRTELYWAGSAGDSALANWLQRFGGNLHRTRQKACVALCAGRVLLRREPGFVTCQRHLGRDSIK